MERYYAIELSNDVYPGMEKYYGFSDMDISFLCAIESLLTNTTIDRIFTRELCKVAHKGKDYFYHYYKNKRALIDHLTQKICQFLASQLRVEDGKVLIDLDEEKILFMLTWSELFPGFRKIVVSQMKTDRKSYATEEFLLLSCGLSWEQVNRFIIVRYGIKGAIDSWLFSSMQTNRGIKESAIYLANEIKSLTDWINR